VLGNTFLVSKDTLGTGYNQVKGLNLFGKFLDGKIHDVDIIKNAEVIYYSRNEAKELVGIDKSVSNKINILFDKNAIETITRFKQIDGILYPESELPENARTLRGLNWRGDERIKSKDDVFSKEEDEEELKVIEATAKDKAKEATPMKIRKETLDYDKKKSKK
jgi:hypothetical protein